MTDRTFPEIMDEIAHLNALIQQHQNDVSRLIEEARTSLMANIGDTAGRTAAKRAKSIRVWSDWLGVHGPATRQDCFNGTGVRLSTTASKSVLSWRPHMEDWTDTQLPGDTLMVIPGLSDGKGRPPSIYFLWRQRFDLVGKFGIGPVREDDSKAMLGVVMPAPEPEPVETSSRYLDLDEWELAWSDRISTVRNGGRLTAEDRLLMRGSVPDGYDPNEVLNLAAHGRLSELEQ